MTYSDIRIINSDKQNIGFLIYPNPAKNFVTVSLSDYSEPVEIIIYNYNGKKIKHQQISKQDSRISLIGLKGIYTIILINAKHEKIAQEKIVVQ